MAFPGNLAYRLSRHKSVFEHCRTCVRTLRSMLKYYLFHDRHCQISWKRSTALMQWLREGKSSSRFTSLATVPKSTYSVPYALKLANFGVALKLAKGGSEACKYSFLQKSGLALNYCPKIGVVSCRNMKNGEETYEQG